MVKLVGTVAQIELQMPRGKTTRALLSLTVALAVLAVIPHSTVAQFIPCKIVNLNVVPSTVVQAGQPFQVTTNLTVSCDPSVLPVIRVDLLDGTSSATLSTNSVPYYPSTSSFIASVVDQATSRQLTGSWALQVQAYVISGLSGRSLASTAQLFQVNVEPYTPAATETQTTEATIQVSSAPFAASTQLFSATIPLENQTEARAQSQNQIPPNTQMVGGSTEQFLVPAAILLAGLVVFGLLIFAGGRRTRGHAASSVRCGQCGTELNHNEKYCTNCGAKQTKYPDV